MLEKFRHKKNKEHLPDVRETIELRRDIGRVVFFGSNLSGATDVANIFNELASTLDTAISVVAERDVSRILPVFFGAEEGERQSLPLGVVVFPQMRQYDWNGHGMFVYEHVSYIRDLCEDNGVPFVALKDGNPGIEGAEFQDGLKAIAAASRQLPPDASV